MPEIFNCKKDINGNIKWIADYSQIDSYSRYKRQQSPKICEPKCMEMPKMANSDFNEADINDCIKLNPGKYKETAGKGITGICHLKCKSEYTPIPEKVICEKKTENEAEWIGYDKYGKKIKYECKLKT